MKKEDVIRIRKELHHLSNADRDQLDKDGNRTINIPLIVRVNTSYNIDEMTSCVIWDDTNEIIYVVEYNNDTTDPLNTICNMQIKAFPYSSIEMISARADKLTLDKFFEDKVKLGLTSEAVRKHYNRLMQEISDPRSYVSTGPYSSTEKRGMRPDDIVMNRDAYKTL